MLSQAKEVLPNGYSPLLEKRDPYLPMGILDLTGFWEPEYRKSMLDDFVSLKDDTAELIFTEAPLFPDLLQSSGDNGMGYQEDYLSPLSSYLELHGIQFVRTGEFLPTVSSTDTWWDWVHLNSIGSKKFSEWLANDLFGSRIVFGEE